MARKATRKTSTSRKAKAASKKSTARKPAKKAARPVSRKAAAKKTAKKRPIKAAKRRSVAKTAPSKVRREAGKKTNAKRAPTPQASVRKAVPKVSRASKMADQQAKVSHPGMMGDGTEEQNLNEPGNPGARITKDEVDAAFKNSESKKN